MKYKKGKHLPGKLPDTWIFTYALDLQPDNTTFDSSVTVSMKNALGFAPGTLIPVGVWNDSTLQWDDTGIMAEVSADSHWVEYQVDHFTPYDINFPPPPC